jgi:hypothetical protein
MVLLDALATRSDSKHHRCGRVMCASDIRDHWSVAFGANPIVKTLHATPMACHRDHANSRTTRLPSSFQSTSMCGQHCTRALQGARSTPAPTSCYKPTNIRQRSCATIEYSRRVQQHANRLLSSSLAPSQSLSHVDPMYDTLFQVITLASWRHSRSDSHNDRL